MDNPYGYGYGVDLEWIWIIFREMPWGGADNGFNPRPVRAFLITRTVRGGGWYDPPPGDRPLMVVELRGKKQSMCLDEISRLHILFLVLGQHLT